MTETALGALFMALGALGWWMLYRRTGDALHPLGLMLAFWLVVFGFGHWDVAATYDEPYYGEPFGAVTYAAVLGSLLAFVFGYWLADPGMPVLDRAAMAARLRRFLDPSALKPLVLVLFAIASAVTVWFVRQAGEIPLFSPRVDQLRLIWKRPLWGYVYDLHFLVALLSAVLAVEARRTPARVGWIALGLASVVQLAFGAVRASPLTGLGWAAVYLFYRRSGAVRLRHLALAALVVLGVSSVIEYYRRAPLRAQPELANPRLDLGPAATLWGHTGASFKNLQLTLQRDVPPLDLGATTYDLPKTLVPSLRARDAELSYSLGVHNSPTYLFTLWLDFGIFGLVVVPGLYGALVGFSYRMFRQRTNLVWLLIYIDFLLATVLAFRTHRFLGNPLLFVLPFGLAIHLLAGRRGEPSLGGGADPAPPEEAPEPEGVPA